MDLQKLTEEAREAGLVVLGINTADDRDIAMNFLVEHEITFPNLLDTRMEAAVALMAYETLGMSAVPMTYLLDPEGKVIEAWYGYQAEHARKVLDELKGE